MTKSLSPTTQAMIDASNCAGSRIVQLHIAAAIRALVEAKLPEEPPPHRGMRPGGSTLTWQESLSVERQRLRQDFLAAADELEGEA